MEKPFSILRIVTLLIFCWFAAAQQGNAQDSPPKFDTLTVSTSAVCGMCKKTIESNLGFEKGVKTVNLDLATNEVTVVYKPVKTDEASIKEALVKLGYTAGEIPANKKAKSKLHSCCQAPD